jgi:hypothetical protein
MTRLEAIATITAKLSLLDDERLQAVAEMIDDIAADEAVRPLTARELALIEQSKEDFAAGRTYSVDEVRAHSDAFIRALRDKHAATS